MTAGKAWPSELRTYEDRRTGVVVRQLTNYPAHSHHFYFTHSGWYANESKLLVASDRENKTDLFSIDLQTYAITQLTDLTPLPLPREVEFLRACTNPVRDEAYFWYGYELVALDLSTLAQRPLYRMPDGYDVSMISCSADGRYVYCSISEDMSDKSAWICCGAMSASARHGPRCHTARSCRWQWTAADIRRCGKKIIGWGM